MATNVCAPSRLLPLSKISVSPDSTACRGGAGASITGDSGAAAPAAAGIIASAASIATSAASSALTISFQKLASCLTQWILPCQIDHTQRTVDHSHFDGVRFAAC
jgi:hypothetical protein